MREVEGRLREAQESVAVSERLAAEQARALGVQVQRLEQDALHAQVSYDQIRSDTISYDQIR